MKTITLNIYSFDELSEDAKKVAIENVRNTYYENNDFILWAIDDCALFEPKHEELNNLFGKDYKFPLIANTRNSIYLSLGQDYFLDCSKAIEVTNEGQFLTWLGLPEHIQNEISYTIYTPTGRNSDTTIEFEELDENNGFGKKEYEILESAKVKFDNHIESVLERISEDYDYRFTDKAIVEDIEANEMEFLICGEVYL